MATTPPLKGTPGYRGGERRTFSCTVEGELSDLLENWITARGARRHLLVRELLFAGMEAKGIAPKWLIKLYEQ